jgi:hypothetical protein
VITVQRLDGTAAAFEACDVLRVRFSVVPLSRDKVLVVAIDIVGDETTIYVRGRFDEIVAQIELDAAMAEFTDADGRVVAINPARVSDIQPNGRQEAGDARTVLVVGGLRQAIQEPQATAMALIGYSRG